MGEDEAVIEKARNWRRAQRAKKDATTPAEKEAVEHAEYNAMRKLANAVDSLEIARAFQLRSKG